jgi:tetratricopeptide (TPR) repeat protein
VADGVFVGRSDSIGHLGGLVRAAADGRPGVVLVEGAPGVGKTTLVHHVLAQVEGVRLVDAVADDAETDVAWGVLEQLARAVSPDAAEELAAMVAIADASAVGAWLLRQIDALESDGPIAIVVDDVPWADRLSVTALSFSLRRLRSDRVVALFTARSRDVGSIPQGLHQLLRGPNGSVVHLGGLEPPELTALFAAHGVSMQGSAARRLVEQTAGNPLHLTALLAEMPAESLAVAPTGRPLPAPASFRSLVLGRLATCGEDTRRLVEVAAATGTRCSFAEVAAVADLGAPIAALDEAVSRDLLEEVPDGGGGRQLGWTHPMVRSAVYNDLGPARRAELHRRIAGATADPWARLRHLVDATVGHDEALADELAAYAAQRAGGGPGPTADAAAAYRMAASLTADASRREDLVLRSLECLVAVGDAVGVGDLIAEVDTFADTARRRYLQASLLAISEGTADAVGTAVTLLESAWDALSDDDDPSLRAGIATQLATIQLNRLHFPDVDLWSRRAIDTGGTSLLSEPYMASALSQAGVGRPEEAVARIPPPPADGGFDLFGIQRAFAAGVAALWSDDPAGALPELEAAYETARAFGVFFAATLSLVYLSDAEYRLGRFDDSIRHAELAASTADDADQRWFVSLSHGNAALALAARGEVDAARAHVDAARSAEFTTAYVLWAEYAALVTDLVAGDVAAGRQAVDRLGSDPSHALGMVAVKPWQLAVAEWHLCDGDPDAAERALAQAVDEVAQFPRPLLSVPVARLRAGIHAARGETEAALDALRRSCELAAACPSPYEVARAHLDLGAMLRRGNERREAAEHLDRRGVVARRTRRGAVAGTGEPGARRLRVAPRGPGRRGRAAAHSPGADGGRARSARAAQQGDRRRARRQRQDRRIPPRQRVPEARSDEPVTARRSARPRRRSDVGRLGLTVDHRRPGAAFRSRSSTVRTIHRPCSTTASAGSPHDSRW